MENAKIQSLNKTILLGDTIPNFDALKENLSAETWPEGFLHVHKRNSVQFYYIVNDDRSEPPQLLASVIITKELALRAYVHGALLPFYIYKHVLPSKYLRQVSQLANVLALCKSLIFVENTTSSAKSQANLVLIAAAILEKCVEEERNMEYHDEFSSRLFSFVIDQLKLLCIPEQARRYSVSIIRISFLWQLTSSWLYKKLHEFFILPSVRRLQSLSSSAAVSSGQIDVEYLAQKTQNLPPMKKLLH